MLFLVDIDGTIADNSHRSHILEGHEGEIPDSTWQEFFKPELVAQDEPIQIAKATLWLFDTLGIEAMYVTGRDENIRSVTWGWLKKNDFPLHSLRMRATGDTRSNREVKIDLVSDLAGYSDVLILDDEIQVRGVADEHGFMFMQAPECWDILYLLLGK